MTGAEHGEAVCGIDGCEYAARPWATAWAYHYEQEHADRMVTEKVDGLVIPDAK